MENEREVTSGDKTGKESIRILERSVRWTEEENQETDIYRAPSIRRIHYS